MHQISVLVVDDSVVVRRLITTALADQPDITVVGTASNGRIALARIDQLAPDVVTLDIEMPEMDGITAVREIRKTRPRLPVIMFSTLTSSGASATLDALAAGASDYVTKPANVGSVTASMQMVRDQLIPRIRALAGRPAPGARPVTLAPRPARPALGGLLPARVEVIAIGCSTGGPEALATVLKAFPATLPVPVVVVQHMPPVFTRMFAERLDRSVPMRVTEAADGMAVLPGTVYIAPGDYHLEVRRRGAGMVTHLHTGPQENFCRPAVDVLFRSVAQAYRGGVLAVVLTGMGQDGRRGAEVLREGGARVLVQDQATSVVWGMPGAVAEAGLADEVLPLSKLAEAVTRAIGSRRPEASLVHGAT